MPHISYIIIPVVLLLLIFSAPGHGGNRFSPLEVPYGNSSAIRFARVKISTDEKLNYVREFYSLHAVNSTIDDLCQQMIDDGYLEENNVEKMRKRIHDQVMLKYSNAYQEMEDINAALGHVWDESNGDVPSMEKLGLATKTDKITWHGYHRFYQRFMDPFRYGKSSGNAVHLLEVGVNKGKSVEFWRNYFSGVDFHYVGIDIAFNRDACHLNGCLYHAIPSTASENQTITLYQGNSSDLTFMDSLMVKIEHNGPLNIIVDDGSHNPKDQMILFLHLFPSPYFATNGVYVIEDVETSYWPYYFPQANVTEGSADGSPVSIFKSIVDVMNREFFRKTHASILGVDIDQLIESVTFGKNCIIIVKQDKQTAEKYEHNEEYIWKDVAVNGWGESTE